MMTLGNERKLHFFVLHSLSSYHLHKKRILLLAELLLFYVVYCTHPDVLATSITGMRASQMTHFPPDKRNGNDKKLKSLVLSGICPCSFLAKEKPM